jgi:glyoxylase-like metal-dependent hydrolase (beta-lactamase superfamily II)
LSFIAIGLQSRNTKIINSIPEGLPMKTMFALISTLFLLSACSQTSQVSSQATATAAPAPVYEIKQVTGNLYHARSDGHNTLFLITPKGTILADPLNLKFAEWLKGQLAERFNSTVKYVIYSHHHWDHASGGAAFADTAEFVGHANMAGGLTAELPANYVGLDANSDGMLQFEEAAGAIRNRFYELDTNSDGNLTGTEINIDVIPPTITYSSDTHSVYLAGREVQLVHINVHSNDGSILFFTEEAVGFGADWLNIKALPRTLYGSAPEEWIKSVDTMAGIGISRVVPGHGDIGRLDDLKAYGQYFRDLKAAVDSAIEKGMTVEELQASISLDAYSDWTGYKERLPTNAAEAYNMAIKHK